MSLQRPSSNLPGQEQCFQFQIVLSSEQAPSSASGLQEEQAVSSNCTRFGLPSANPFLPTAVALLSAAPLVVSSIHPLWALLPGRRANLPAEVRRRRHNNNWIPSDHRWVPFGPFEAFGRQHCLRDAPVNVVPAAAV